MAEAWRRLQHARVVLSEAGSSSASGLDGRAFPWTPLRFLTCLPVQCRESIVQILDLADPTGFLSHHLLLLALVLTIWMVAAMSMASRHALVRRWVASFWVWWQAPSTLPIVGFALVSLAILLEQDALVVYLKVDNYCSAAAQTLAACVLATIGCAEPKLKVLRVQQAVSVQCMTFGCLVAIVSTRILVDLQHKELDMHTDLPEARYLSLLFAMLGVVAGLHGVGRLLGLPLLSGCATRFGKLIVVLVRLGLVWPSKQLSKVMVEHIAPAVAAVMRKVVALLRPAVQLLLRRAWGIGKTCWRRLQSFLYRSHRVLDNAARAMCNHIFLPVYRQVLKFMGAFTHWGSLAVEWLSDEVFLPLWLDAQRAARLVCRLWHALYEAWFRLMATFLQVLHSAAEAGELAIAVCSRWITCWVIAPLCSVACSVLGTLQEWGRWMVQIFYEEVVLVLWLDIKRVSRRLRRLLLSLASCMFDLLRRLWEHLSARLSVCLRTLSRWMRLACREAMSRVVIPAFTWMCRVTWRLMVDVLWPAMVTIGRATVPVRRLVSPSGCFVTAASFTYYLWRHMQGSEPLGFFTVVAFALAAHCSASIGILLCGRALRITFVGQDLAVVGAKLESVGAWLFLHADLALSSRVWTTCTWFYRYSSLTLLQVVAALVSILRSVAVAAEGLLDQVLHTLASSSIYAWQAWIRPTLVLFCRSFWGAISLVWRNPLASVAASGAVMAYMYQVHLGRASLPDFVAMCQVLRGLLTLPLRWMPLTACLWSLQLLSRLGGCSLTLVSILWDGVSPAVTSAGSQAFGLLSKLSSRPLEMYSMPVFAKVAAMVGLACSRISLLVGRNLSWQEQMELAARIGRTSQRMLFIPVLSLAMVSQVGSWILLGFAGLAAAPLTLVYVICSVAFLVGEVAVWRTSSARLASHRQRPDHSTSVAAGERSSQPTSCHFTPAAEARLLFCEDGEDCTVCMEPMQIPQSTQPHAIKHKVVALRCGHAFHEECIKAWVQKSKRCPLCREVVAGRGHILQALF
mmetsp:Transcript_48077/g.88582  ORF Transcript_48077/g.88582 Transcript_48077/m.88582 type:complete len:1023 (+) Transcript_48077:50-3118(+)